MDGGETMDGVIYGAGVVIRWSRVHRLHPATSGICFLVVPSPRSRFVNSTAGQPPASWDF